jgi:hypothetical protein
VQTKLSPLATVAGLLVVRTPGSGEIDFGEVKTADRERSDFVWLSGLLPYGSPGAKGSLALTCTGGRVAAGFSAFGEQDGLGLVRLDLIETTDREGSELKERYRQAKTGCTSLQMRRETLARQCKLVSEELVNSHLAAGPRPLFRRIFNGGLLKEKVRGMLALVCPKIAYLGKPWRFAHEFQVEVVTGNAIAHVTGSEPVDRLATTYFIRVQCGAELPTPWIVEVLPAPTGAYVAVGSKD